MQSDCMVLWPEMFWYSSGNMPVDAMVDGVTYVMEEKKAELTSSRSV